MSKPASITKLETELRLTLADPQFELTDLREHAGLSRVIRHLAALDAYARDEGPEPTAADLRAVALERLRMAPARNMYLSDEAGNVIGLNLSNNQLSRFPFDWPDWRYLEALNLSGNAFSEIELPISLVALRWLDLGDNAALRALSFAGPLPRLERLEAMDGALESFALPGLDRLTYLDLARNKLAGIEFQGDCPRMEWLDLSGNKLEEFSLHTGFRNLAFLYLNNNRLSKLYFPRPLRQLETLHLRDNRLTSLPEDLPSFTALESLYLHGNPWSGILASIVPEGENTNAFRHVHDYLHEHSKGTLPNDRVKIIIIGNGRTGKTSLFRRLLGKPFRKDERFTHGVRLGELEKRHLPEVKTAALRANVWDFGGQEIFYATHQFFLTNDALYILAWTALENVETHRERDRNELPLDDTWRSREYWLENIRQYAPQSPILLVQTHSDEKQEPYDQTAYARQPYNAECLDFSANTDDGLVPLKNKIARQLNERITAFGEEFPVTYDLVIAEVERRRDENKITHAQFNRICQAAGISPGGEASVLDYLNKVGEVVWFPQVAALGDTVFVNPDWLTKQVYRLIRNDLYATRGRITTDYIDAHWPEYDAAEKEQFLALLQSFELIFKAKQEGVGVYVSPQYLPDSLDYDGKTQLDKTKRRLKLAFWFRFTRFTPENVMVNFLSRYGPYSDQIYWKNGISFTTTQEIDCVVEFDETTKIFSVYVPDSPAGSALEGEVCRAFVELSKNAQAEISLDANVFTPWDTLKDALEKVPDGVVYLNGNPIELKQYRKFFQKDLPPEPPQPEPVAKPTIFFSYAWGAPDEPGENRETIVDELYDSLAADDKYALQRDKKDVGYRHSIRAFMQALGRGEFIVVVISDKYLKSPYCMFELLEIYKKSNSDEQEFREKLFPIVLGDAKINTLKAQLQYVAFWKKECDEIKAQIEDIGIDDTVDSMPTYAIYKEIRQHIGRLTGILADINTRSPQMLSAANFAEIKTAIDQRAESLKDRL